jgi:hypothetical protein
MTNPERNRNGMRTIADDRQHVNGGLTDWLVSALGDDAAEAAWTSALALVEQAAQRAREGRFGRWRNYPDADLRRLRRDVAQALWLARTACAMQHAGNDLVADLTAGAREAGHREAAARRRAGTVEAERVRLVRRRARAEGREPTSAELHPWLDDVRR